MQNSQSVFQALFIAILSVLLIACNAATTSITKQDLKVETKMSSTIFLEPVSQKDKTIYLQVRNTTDKPNLDLTGPIYSALINKGYEVTNRAEAAHYLLQVNVLQAGELNAETRDELLGRGFGDAAVGALAGAGLGTLIGNNSHSAIAGALAGAAIGGIAGAAFKDVTYSVITDVQVTEKKSNGKTQVHQTRIASTANKVNLDFAQAEPDLVAGLARSIAGIF